MKVLNYLTKEYKGTTAVGLLLLRIVAGLVLFYGHGFGKLSTVFGGDEIMFGDPIGIGATPSFYMAAFAEGICALLLITGIFTRAAAFVLVLNFLVILSVHINDGFPILELRFFYLASFLALFLLGPGRLSLDHLLFNRRREPVLVAKAA